MKVTFGRVLSFMIAIGYVVAMILVYGWVTPCLILCLFPFFPVALIWFPDELGAARGWIGGGMSLDEDTPAIFVSIMGWLLLVGMPFIFYFFLGK
jgi:hypothetical protein